MDQFPVLNLCRSVWLIDSLSLRKGVRETFFHEKSSQPCFAMSSPHMPRKSGGGEWKREPSPISPMKQWGCSIFECVQGAIEMTNTLSFRAFHSHQRTKWLAKLWVYRHTKAFSWFLVLISDIFNALGDAPYHSLVKEAQLLCLVIMQKTNLPGPSHQEYFLFWKAITPLVMRAGTTLTESKTFNSEERCLQREYFYMETQRTD